jgi:hypothetical protein
MALAICRSLKGRSSKTGMSRRASGRRRESSELNRGRRKGWDASTARPVVLERAVRAMTSESCSTSQERSSESMTEGISSNESRIKNRRPRSSNFRSH